MIKRVGILFIQVVGRLTVFLAMILFLLFLANLRSRFYFHGPNYSFLLWMSFYFTVTLRV